MPCVALKYVLTPVKPVNVIPDESVKLPLIKQLPEVCLISVPENPVKFKLLTKKPDEDKSTISVPAVILKFKEFDSIV